MEAKRILQSDLIDLIFDDRNKDYGAYELRKKYNKRIGIAVLSTLLIAAAFIGGSVLLKPSDEAVGEVNVREVVIEDIKEIKPPPPPPPKKEEPPPPPEKAPPAKAPPMPKIIETTKFTPPVIKKDIEVKPQEIAPVGEIKKVDVATVSGVKEPEVITPPPPAPPAATGTGKENSQGTGEAKAPPAEDPNKVHESVDVKASVNMSAWRRHLENQLQRYVEDAANGGMSPGKYTVQVRFLVEKDGSIGDVKALNDPGHGLGKAAVDVVRRGPRWTAAEQGGQKVRSYHTQPITFMITGDM